MDSDNNDICDICGYISDHTHTYATEWTQGVDTHYHKATCGHDKMKKDEAAHTDANNDGACDVCGYNGGHEHTYDEAWTPVDESGHWHAATCGHDVEGIDKAPHVDENNDGDCDVCGYNGGHEHTYADTWSTDGNEHWKDVTCGHDVAVGEKGVHIDADGDSLCDICGHAPEHFHTFEDTLSWDANGHFYKANCGHDVRKDEAAHVDADDNGVCDVCTYVIFHRYTVTVTVPDYVTVTAPDGSTSNSFLVKEGTEATFTLTVPKYAEVTGLQGATFVGEPVEEGDVYIYTAKVANLTAERTVTLTANKLRAVEILAEVATVLPITQQFYNTMTIEISVPSAGDYAVYSYDNWDVTFGTEESTALYYAFHADEAGTVSVLVKYFAWSVPESGELPFTYVVYKLDDPFRLPAQKGEGYTMPTNVPIHLEILVPTPGIWSLSSSVTGIAWDNNLTSTYTFVTTEPNQTVTVEMMYELLGYATFTFDWTLSTYEAVTVNEGTTSLTVPYGDYKAIVFKAPADGTYHFDLGHSEAYFYSWDSTYQQMTSQGNEFNLTLVKDESVTYYVAMYPYGDTRADVDDVLSIENYGYFPPYENGGYTALTGTQNAFENGSEEGDYLLSVPDNAQISIDNGKTWHSSVTIPVGAYETITYRVQTNDGSTEVKVTFKRIAYEFTLTMGTQTVTMKPDKEYNVYLTGFTSEDYYKSFILSWANAGITASYNGQTIVSGATVGNYATYYTVTIVLSADAETDVQFTLGEATGGSSGNPGTGDGEGEEPFEPVIPDVDDSDTNPTLLNGEYRVNFIMNGLYILTFKPASAGAAHGTLEVVDNNNYKYDGTYTYVYGTKEGVIVYNSNGTVSDITITIADNGTMTFKCNALGTPQTLIKG